MQKSADLRELASSPVRIARHKLDLSLHAAAGKADVNYQTWYLTERGCYRSVPPRISDFLEEEGGFNSLTLEKNYKFFIKETRAQFKTFYSRLYQHIPVESLVSLDYLYHSFGMGRTAFAKALCVQPAVLYKYESGEQADLPAQLREALLEVGLPLEIIVTLEAMSVRSVRDYSEYQI